MFFAFNLHSCLLWADNGAAATGLVELGPKASSVHCKTQANSEPRVTGSQASKIHRPGKEEGSVEEVQAFRSVSSHGGEQHWSFRAAGVGAGGRGLV